MARGLNSGFFFGLYFFQAPNRVFAIQAALQMAASPQVNIKTLKYLAIDWWKVKTMEDLLVAPSEQIL